MNLTAEQQSIVNHTGSHARVSAVAGSGKTTTMVARVGMLLQRGVNPGEILVLMFNKSARDSFAGSMEKRLRAFGGQLPEVRTFHSLGMRLVNSFTRRGALPGYSLVTEDYVQEKLARQVANEVYRQEQGINSWLAGDEIEEFLAYIDLVKSTVFSPDEVFRKLGLSSRYTYFIKAYELFEEIRRKQRIRFYADLIHEPLMAMQGDDGLAAWVTDRVEHIIVDEYQDINEVQQHLLKILAGTRAKVMVVGDVRQCIYEWRGAQPEYITTRFQKDFPHPKEYQLSYTFRYGHQLSLAANHLIAWNKGGADNLCISHKANPDTVITCLEDGVKHPVVSVIASWMKQGRSLGEAVVLVRLFAMSVVVELALLEAGIPYRIEGNSQVFDCPEILALTGYLNLVLGRLGEVDPLSLRPMINAMLSQPHLGVKKEVMDQLVQQISENPDAAPELLLEMSQSDLAPFICKRFEEAASNWRWLAGCSSTGRADTLLKRIVEKLKLYDFYHNFSARSATAENRVKTCQAFIAFAASQKLSVHQLLSRIQQYRELGENPSSEALLITSIHRAKGLEWPLVILPGLEEGAFPFFQEREGWVEDMEDERRLFYVAITRAIEEVVCIHPKDQDLKSCMAKCCGTPPGAMVRASRFLYESNPGLSIGLGKVLVHDDQDRIFTADDTTIARRYLEAIGAKAEVRDRKADEEVRGNTVRKILEISEIAEGLRVWHQVFGAGTVMAVKDRRQGRLLVSFDEHGEMILLASYAKLLAYEI